MESSKGYRLRSALRNVDSETGREEYSGALPKDLTSFGASWSTPGIPVSKTPNKTLKVRQNENLENREPL